MNTETQTQPLTGRALAEALYVKGLGPNGVQRQEYMDGPVFWRNATRKWEPSRNIGDVWHLVRKYRMAIVPLEEDYYAVTAWHPLFPGELSMREEAEKFQDIPAAIAHLALRLAAQEDLCK